MDKSASEILKPLPKQTEDYLNQKLIPFWVERAVEPKYGGFQSNYDKDGNRTEVTEKSFLSQVRSIFTISHAMRQGFDWPNGKETVKQGIDFLKKYFHDKKYDGYYWIVEEDGTPKDMNKIIYGHSFLIYGFSEYALLTGDNAAKEEAIRIFNLLQDKVADKEYGGYYEHFDRAFNLKQARGDIKAHKSLDVHMHLMEAFTTLYELTGEEVHRKALTDVIDLIFDKMIEGDGCYREDNAFRYTTSSYKLACQISMLMTMLDYEYTVNEEENEKYGKTWHFRQCFYYQYNQGEKGKKIKYVDYDDYVYDLKYIFY